MNRPYGRPGSVAVIIAAGGAGTRLGPGAPKAFRVVAGEPLLVHALWAVAAAGCVDHVVVAAPAGAEQRTFDLLSDRLPVDTTLADQFRVEVITGGAQRQDSVAAGMAALPPEVGVVLVHDAARAFAPAALFTSVVDAVRAGHPAVVPVMPVVDTVVAVDPAGAVVERPDRARLRAVQTPQGFAREALEAGHQAAPGSSATDDAGLVAQAGYPVHTIDGAADAVKITGPDDLTFAERLAARATGTRTLPT